MHPRAMELVFALAWLNQAIAGIWHQLQWYAAKECGNLVCISMVVVEMSNGWVMFSLQIAHFTTQWLHSYQIPPLMSSGLIWADCPLQAKGQKFNSSHLWPKTLKMIRAKYAADFENFNYTCQRCPD